MLPSVAVAGVPRGGTSITVGLLRILGLRLPNQLWGPICQFGECSALRETANSLRYTPAEVCDALAALPPGTVWKDPSVGKYAHLVPWRKFLVVRVRRDVHEVAASERKWLPGSKIDHVRQAQQWSKALDRRIPPEQVVADVEFGWVRSAPVAAMQYFAERLQIDPPTADQQLAARWYAKESGGYRCPLPGRCDAGPSAH